MDFEAMMKQAQELQSRLLAAQEEARGKVVQASAGGGMVTVEVTGALEVRRIHIDPAAIDPKDPTLLADLVTAAVNQGLEKAKELQASAMQAVTGGLPIPGMF